jgi:hypothetical protein
MEDAGDAGGLERVELGVQGLAEGGGAGVADPRVPGRFGPGRRGAGQLDPRRTRLADGRGRDVERLGQGGHEPEPGGVVLNGHLALAGAARRPGRGGAGRHGAVVGLHPDDVVLVHPESVSCGCFIGGHR